MKLSAPFLGAFLLANLLLGSFFLDAWLTPNATSRALPVLTLYEQGTLRIDDYSRYTVDKALVNGHYYSDKAPLSTLIVYPFYRLFRAIFPREQERDLLARFPIYIWEPITQELDGRLITFARLQPVLLLGSFVCGTLPFLMLVAATFVYCNRQAGTPSAVVLAMFGCYGTYLFVLSGTYFGGVLAGAFLLGAYLVLKPLFQGRETPRQALILAGLLGGLAATAEYTSAVVLPLWAGLMFLRRRSAGEVILFSAGVLPVVIGMLVYNQLTTGSPFDLTYHHQAAEEFAPMREALIGFGLPRIEAFWGLTFSPFRGIFFYAPVLILVAYLALGRLRKEGPGFLTGNLLVLPILVHFLTVSCFYMWWGGWAYGPRHLAPLAVLAVFEGTLQIGRLRPPPGAFLLLSVWGIAMGWMAKATRVYMLPGDVGNPLSQLIVPDLIQMKCNANNLLSLIFGVPPAPASLVWLLLFFGSTYGLAEWHRRLIGSAGRSAGGTGREDGEADS